MKKLSLGTILIACWQVNALETSPEDLIKIKHEYFKFVAEYGKQLATKEEMDERFEIFHDNYRKIEAHNSHIDEEGRSPPFTLGINQFSDMTEQEFMADRFGGVKVPHRLSHRLKSAKASQKPQLKEGSVEVQEWRRQEMPDYKNWFEEGMVSTPYDQGACGSCWAFSAAATLESLAKIQGFDEEVQEYSVQQLMDCDKQNFQCDGGWMYEAYEYTQQHGIMLKGQYAHSYTPHAQHCKQTDEFHFRNTDMMEHDQMTNDEIKEQLLVQPVGVAIYSTGMLQSYTKGIVTEEYLHCSKESNEVNHGVVLVGFGTHKDEKVRGHCKDYWIVRNSWGGRWGEGGFFKLCADNPFSEKLPFGTCLVNQFGTWPI